MTRDRVIGNNNGLPWNIPEEYEQFLNLVRGQAVIFGRKSYEIFGRDLPDSELFVVTRSSGSLPEVQTCGSIDEAAKLARQTGKQVFSAGGAAIYRLSLPLASSMYLSIVKGDYHGDTLFPEFNDVDWRITQEDEYPEFVFRNYERISRRSLNHA